ncbi:DUF6911 family protein [Burkholderia ubonensis]|uniref:DUF6911 family protein n=1 Tax=Burkholderia ubonensis TaxID=101571 RepID=UPI0012FB6EB3|nr:hypothetical protein [Burkholderia ubonensis]
MREYLLSWSVGSNNDRDGGRKNNPTWVDVESALVDAWKKSGTVTLDITRGPEVGPQSLQVQSENGRSIITLGVDTGLDYIVRSYVGGENSANQVEILGDLWSSGSICVDFNVVVKIFSEFLEAGDVSGNMLA